MKPEEENRLAEISHRLVTGDPASKPQAVLPPKSLLPPKAKRATAASEDPRSAPETLQEFGKKQNSTLSLAVGLLLLVLALALAAGVWWKLRHSAAPKAQTPPPVAATRN